MIMKYRTIFYYICLLVLFSIAICYPIKREDFESKVAFKDEKRYPNGTVIGKYTYNDKEGNPVHVKYFADDSSYGVELKSIKVFDTNSDMMHYNLPKLEYTMSPSNVFPQLEAMNTANSMFSKEFNKNKTYNPFEVLNSYPNKMNRYKETHKANDDYEIFLENDLKSTEKCDKEKVKVYLDKNKRKTRNVPYRYKPSGYCKRF